MSFEPPILVKEGGEVLSCDRHELYARLHIAGIIRIQSQDYEQIFPEGMYAHFNVARTRHVVGCRYALPRILTSGFFDEKTGEDRPPVLSFKNIYFGTCVDIAHEISYKQVTPEMFQYSMAHIKSIEQLKEAMVDRYSKSRTTLTVEDILALCVSWTLLKLEPRTTPIL